LFNNRKEMPNFFKDSCKHQSSIYKKISERNKRWELELIFYLNKTEYNVGVHAEFEICYAISNFGEKPSISICWMINDIKIPFT